MTKIIGGAFLSSLAQRGVSASTQNQALSAVLFLHEVVRMLDHVQGTIGLMASLMYGAGLRLMECVELRVNDLNLDRGELIVRDGKGGKDRVTMLPVALKRPPADQV